MAAGTQVTQATVNARAGSLAQAVRDVLGQVTNFTAWLTAQTDAQLLAMGFVQADITTMRAAFADLNGLTQIYNRQAVTTGFGGQVATGPSYDFQSFARQLYGGN